MERTSAKTLQGEKYRIEIASDSRIVTAPGIVFVTTAKVPISKAEVVVASSTVPEPRHLRVVA